MYGCNQILMTCYNFNNTLSRLYVAYARTYDKLGGVAFKKCLKGDLNCLIDNVRGVFDVTATEIEVDRFITILRNRTSNCDEFLKSLI